MTTRRALRDAHLHLLRAALIAVLALALAPALASARAPRRPVRSVPQGFFGVDASIPQGVNVPSQFDSMVADGVESVRLQFLWSAMQPYASFSQVPAAQRSRFVNVGGVPTTFALYDLWVAAAAEHGLSVMAIIYDAPAWDSKPRPCGSAARDLQAPSISPDTSVEAHAAAKCFYASVPTRDAPFGKFMKALVHHYGPNGSFWKLHPNLPRHPIRLWTVWNEPNFLYNWGPQPFTRRYMALLKVAHAAVKSVDPGAKVILAGVANAAWTTLQQIYAIPGARRSFDAVDIHPYTKQPSGVIEILRRVRAVMNRAGDRRKPIIVGEYTWPSSVGQSATGVFDTETTVRGQASKLRAVLPLFAANRKRLNLIGTYYYTWMGIEAPGLNTFNFAGLLAERQGHVVAKPALGAFRTAALKLEHCKRKGTLATVCKTRGT